MQPNNQQTPPTPTTVPFVNLPVSPNPAPQVPPNTMTVGLTGATGLTAAPLIPQPIINAQQAITEAKITTMMLCYAVSVYAYRSAFLDTVKNIQESGDGHGIFQTIPADIIGDGTSVSSDDIKGMGIGKEIINGAAMKANQEDIIEEVQAIANDPEKLAKTGMSKEEFFETFSLVAEPNTPQSEI